MLSLEQTLDLRVARFLWQKGWVRSRRMWNVNICQNKMPKCTTILLLWIWTSPFWYDIYSTRKHCAKYLCWKINKWYQRSNLYSLFELKKYFLVIIFLLRVLQSSERYQLRFVSSYALCEEFELEGCCWRYILISLRLKVRVHANTYLRMACSQKLCCLISAERGAALEKPQVWASCSDKSFVATKL